MAKARAGIYFREGKGEAEEVYGKLPVASRARLKVFLEGLLNTLAPPDPKQAAKDPEGVLSRGQYVWEPGCLVGWRVVLRPKELYPSVTRIEAYRVEVLLIHTGLEL